MVTSGLARPISYFIRTTFTLIDNSPFTTGYQSLMVRGLATYIRRLLRPNEIQIDVLPSLAATWPQRPLSQSGFG